MVDSRLIIHGGFAGTKEDKYFHFYRLPKIYYALCRGHIMSNVYLDNSNYSDIEAVEEYDNKEYDIHLYDSVQYAPLAMLVTENFPAQYSYFIFAGSGSFEIKFKYELQNNWNNVKVSGTNWETKVMLNPQERVRFKITFLSPTFNDTDNFYLKEMVE